MKLNIIINDTIETAHNITGASFRNKSNYQTEYYDTDGLIGLSKTFGAYDSETKTINLNVLGNGFGIKKGKWKNNSQYGFISANHNQSKIEFVIHNNKNYRY